MPADSHFQSFANICVSSVGVSILPKGPVTCGAAEDHSPNLITVCNFPQSYISYCNLCFLPQMFGADTDCRHTITQVEMLRMAMT